MKNKIPIMESLKENLNLVINSPAALKHLSASNEGGGRVFRQIFIFFNTLGQSLCGQPVEWCMDAQSALKQVLLLYSLLMFASQDVF